MGILARFTQGIRDEIRRQDKERRQIVADTAFQLWLYRAYEWQCAQDAYEEMVMRIKRGLEEDFGEGNNDTVQS